MNVNRYEAVTRELTPTARKVFDCVPAQEAWTPFRIGTELKRQGVPKDRRVVEGCLVALVQDGLITRDPIKDTYQRIEPRAPALSLVQPQEEPKVNTKKPSHMDRMSALAERARGMAVDLKKLADDIEAAAVLIDEEIADAGRDTTKLRQLQTLLKELT